MSYPHGGAAVVWGDAIDVQKAQIRDWGTAVEAAAGFISLSLMLLGSEVYVPGTIVRTNMERYVYVVADPAATDYHLVNAAGTKYNYIVSGGGDIHVEALGFSSTNTHVQNTAAWVKARDLAISSGVRRIVFPAGTFKVGQMDLPTFTVDDPMQTPQNMIEIEGANEQVTILELDDPSAVHMFGHPSYGLSTDRAQNSFVKIGKMSAFARGDRSVDQPIIRLDNTWAYDIYNMVVGGNMGGNNIDVWSFARGGAQTGTIRNVHSVKERQWEPATPGGRTIYDLNKLYAKGSRYMIGLHGPVDSVGKANNNLVMRCESYYSALGLVDTRPFEANPPADFTSKIFPNGGGVDYLQMMNNFAGFEGWSKIEEGTFETVVSQTVFGLITTAGEFINDTADCYKDMILRVLNPTDGHWYSRRITGYAAGTRELTISSAFPWTVATTDKFEIAYADAKAWAEGMHPECRPHLQRWGSLVYNCVMSNNRVEEGVAIAFMSYAGQDIYEAGTDIISDRQAGNVVFDTPSASEFIETLNVRARGGGVVARGAQGSCAHTVTETLMVGRVDRDDFNSDSVTLWEKRNAAGADVDHLQLVRLSSNLEDLKLSVGYTNGAYTPHFWAYNPNHTKAHDGQACSVIRDGYVKVPLYLTANQVVTDGDEVVSKTGGVAQVLAKGTLTSSQQDLLLARVVQGYTNGATAGTVNLLVKIV